MTEQGVLAALRERVRQARAEVETVEGAYRQVQDEFTRQHVHLLETRAEVRQRLEQEELALRSAAEAHYRATGDKKPIDGVTVTETVALEYDETAVREWCRTAMPQLVRETLDVKAFEKVAKAGGLPFVTLVTTGKARVAAHLDPLDAPTEVTL